MNKKYLSFVIVLIALFFAITFTTVSAEEEPLPPIEEEVITVEEEVGDQPPITEEEVIESVTGLVNWSKAQVEAVIILLLSALGGQTVISLIFKSIFNKGANLLKKQIETLKKQNKISSETADKSLLALDTATAKFEEKIDELATDNALLRADIGSLMAFITKKDEVLESVASAIIEESGE